MHNETTVRLEAFDNDHEFERLCASILAALGYKDVSPVAPRGGSDGGMDITFETETGGKGLACVTLRKDVRAKFKADFEQCQPGEFEKYMFFCSSYVSAALKREFALHCLEHLQAELVTQDVEALRCYLDGPLTALREQYLGIPNPRDESIRALFVQMRNDLDARLLLDKASAYSNAPLYAEQLIRDAIALSPMMRQEAYRELGMMMARVVIEQVVHYERPGARVLPNGDVPWSTYSREEYGQMVRGAIEYLEETIWNASVPDREGLVYLACMYAYQGNTTRMFEVIERILPLGDNAILSLQNPRHLVALLAGCQRDRAAQKQLVAKIRLPDVTAISFSAELHDPELLRGADYLFWLAIKLGNVPSSQSEVTILCITPPFERNNDLVTAVARPIKSGTLEAIASVPGPLPADQLYNALLQWFWLIAPLPKGAGL